MAKASKVFLLVVSFVVLLCILAGCAVQTVQTQQTGVGTEKRIVSAKIRYLDGSIDTVVVDRYSFAYTGVGVLYTEDGRKLIVGVNNVILIEESEAQYNCTE
jgi:hypothetical protein